MCYYLRVRTERVFVLGEERLTSPSDMVFRWYSWLYHLQKTMTADEMAWKKKIGECREGGVAKSVDLSEEQEGNLQLCEIDWLQTFKRLIVSEKGLRVRTSPRLNHFFSSESTLQRSSYPLLLRTIILAISDHPNFARQVQKLKRARLVFWGWFHCLSRKWQKPTKQLLQRNQLVISWAGALFLCTLHRAIVCVQQNNWWVTFKIC